MLPKLAASTQRVATAIGARVRELREHAEVSQQTLATRIGMTRGNYARIEQGQTNVTVDSLLRIAEGLGVVLEVRFVEPSARRPAPARRARLYVPQAPTVVQVADRPAPARTRPRTKPKT